MFTIDCHLDLAMNAMEWNRDLRQSLQDIRASEKGMKDKPDRGNGTVCFEELRKADMGIVIATQIARVTSPGSGLSGWHSPEQAWAQTQAQLAWYKAMEADGQLTMIKDLAGLQQQVKSWQQAKDKFNYAIGYILSLEGADSLIKPEYLYEAHAYGLRAVGPAHYGPGRYANGTNSSGRMGKMGLELLAIMQELNIILDATHLCDDAFWQALENFNGPVWASHHLCRSLVDHNRQLSDEMIKALIDRNAIIGMAMDAWMLVPNWVRGVSDPVSMHCHLDTVLNHLDHICQLAGNTKHVCIGTDLDGAYGTEQCPADLNSIADIQKFPALLQKRGYSREDIENIMYGNALLFLEGAWA